MRSLYLLFPLLLLLSACNLAQPIDLDLPEYEPEVLVESYLIPGNPYFVILSRTVGFFDSLALDYVEGAEVTVRHGGETVTLYELPPEILSLLLATDSSSEISNFLGAQPVIYASARFGGGIPEIELVPEDYESTFQLEVFTPEGDTLNASTRIPAPVPIAYQEIQFNDQEQALILTAIEDEAGVPNFYRRLLVERRRDVAEGSNDTTWISDEQQDFVLDDGFSDGETILFGTGFDFESGDTLISTIYHITEDYFRFVDTRDAAIAASLSPFAQPAQLHTNILGGQGVFVGLTLSRDTAVVP